MNKEEAENEIFEKYFPNSKVEMYTNLGEAEEEDQLFYMMLDSNAEVGVIWEYYGSRGKLKTKIKSEYEQLTNNRDNYEIVSVFTKDLFYINRAKVNQKSNNKLENQYLIDLSNINSESNK